MIARLMGYTALVTCTLAGVAATMMLAWASYVHATRSPPNAAPPTTALARAIELRCIREAQHEKEPTVWVRKIKTCQRQLLREVADEKPQP